MAEKSRMDEYSMHLLITCVLHCSQTGTVFRSRVKSPDYHNLFLECSWNNICFSLFLVGTERMNIRYHFS